MGIYARFADLLEYPDETLADRVRDIPAARSENAATSAALTQFGAEATLRGLTAMQEIYTSAFDFDDRCTLYVGHHLLAATARRGAFMARLAEQYRQSGFACPEHELPDHLAVMLRYLDADTTGAAPMAEGDQVRREMITHVLLPAAQRILQALEAGRNPYRLVMRALAAEMERECAAGTEAAV